MENLHDEVINVAMDKIGQALSYDEQLLRVLLAMVQVGPAVSLLMVLPEPLFDDARCDTIRTWQSCQNRYVEPSLPRRHHY